MNGVLTRLSAVVDIELKLFFRDPSIVALLAVLLGLCFVLTPSPAANYAIITIAGHKPIMTPDTLLVASSLVFAIFIFPLYALLFGIGRKRDYTHKVSALFAMNNTSLALIIAGRLIANIAKVLLMGIVACCGLVLMIYMAFSSLPSSSALLYFCVANIPSGLFAIAISVVLDRYFAGQYNRQLLIVFSLWFGLIALAIHSPFDIFALKLIQPGTFDGQISIGFISAANLPLFDWLHFSSSTLLLLQGVKYLTIGIMTLIFCGGLLYLHSGISLPIRTRYQSKVPTKATSSGALWDNRLSNKDKPLIFTSAWIVIAQWLGLAKINLLVVLCVFFGSAISPNQTSVLIPLVLVVPLLLFTGNKMVQNKVLNQLELTTNALRKPNPILFKICLLLGLIILPLTPSLMHFDGWQLVSFLVGSGVVVTWLFTAFYLWNRPMLAITGYAVTWYVFAINRPPFDLFGITAQLSNPVGGQVSHQTVSLFSLTVLTSLLLSHFVGKKV